MCRQITEICTCQAPYVRIVGRNRQVGKTSLGESEQNRRHSTRVMFWKSVSTDSPTFRGRTYPYQNQRMSMVDPGAVFTDVSQSGAVVSVNTLIFAGMSRCFISKRIFILTLPGEALRVRLHPFIQDFGHSLTLGFPEFVDDLLPLFQLVEGVLLERFESPDRIITNGDGRVEAELGVDLLVFTGFVPVDVWWALHLYPL